MEYSQSRYSSLTNPMYEMVLWAIALATYVIGDLVTTFVGFSLGAEEAHPLANALIGQFGLWVIIPLQLLALSVFVFVWFSLHQREVDARIGIPLGLSILGVLVVSNNVATIYMLLS